MHVPVLLDEVISLLKPNENERYLDLTAGYGGHSSKVLDLTKNFRETVLVDRDENAINYLNNLFKKEDVCIRKQNFSDACDQLIQEKREFDLILADLGASSQHFDIASRGFSFMAEGPLDMRMDQSLEKSAADIVNNESVEDIAKILKDYGEEKKSLSIARLIVKNRPYKTTLELARTLESVLGWRVKGAHPATRVFQALRIAVNDELNLLSQMLPKAVKLLAPGGRFGVITFHSLEDRLVKHFFAEVTLGGYDQRFALLTKKPIVPTDNELVFNPRSRSAKLRGVVKIKKERND